MIRKRYLNLLFVILALLASMSTNTCAKDFDIEKENKKIEKILLDKMDKGIKLTSSEINNISGIFLWGQKYDRGIETLERLKDSENYKNEKYLIYFNLSIFYTKKAKKTTKPQERRSQAEKAEEYLTFGFSNTPEKALAHYLRAKGYAVMGCIEKCNADLQETINIAATKDIIFFEDEIYLTKDKFIQIVESDLNRFKTLKDDCILARE